AQVVPVEQGGTDGDRELAVPGTVDPPNAPGEPGAQVALELVDRGVGGAERHTADGGSGVQELGEVERGGGRYAGGDPSADRRPQVPDGVGGDQLGCRRRLDVGA